MGKESDLIEAGKDGNVTIIEKILAVNRSRARKIPGFSSLGFSFSSLRKNVNANAQNNQGDTALHLASLNGHSEAVTTLLKYDASANLMDASGCFPLHLAAWGGNADVCRTLLTQGPSLAKVNEQNAAGDTALHTAAQYGHTQTVKVLLENFADPFIRNQSGETALDLGCQYGRFDCVRLLLNNCPALVDSCTVHCSPLHYACRNGHKEVVQALLNSGFDVNTVTQSGTALQDATRHGKVDTVALLLTHGADPTLKDPHGRDALQLADELDTAAAREITKIIRLKEETNYASSYPRPSPVSTNSDTSSLKVVKRHIKDASLSPPCSEYAVSLSSSDCNSLLGSSEIGSYCPYAKIDGGSLLKGSPDSNANTTTEIESIYSELRPVEAVLPLSETWQLTGEGTEPISRVKPAVYATVSKQSNTCDTVPKEVKSKKAYSEELYEAFDPNWKAESRDSSLDQSDTGNGGVDRSVIIQPDVDMLEAPPVPPKRADSRDSQADYLEMTVSRNESFAPSPPLLQIAATSDDGYVDVEPVDAESEHLLSNGLDDVDSESHTIVQGTPEKSPSLQQRPPSLVLLPSTPPNATIPDRDDLPTPDHPPPSPTTALRGIQQIINPKDKRRSRDMETSTDGMHCQATTTRAVSQSDRTSKDETVRHTTNLPTTPESGRESEESESESDSDSVVVALRTSTSEPFKGLIKGSAPDGKRRAMSAMYDDIVVRSPVKRSSLNFNIGSPHQPDELTSMFKEIDDIVGDLKANKDPHHQLRRSLSSPERVLESPDRNESGSVSADKTRDDSHSQDWAEIADIMASFGGRITRESVFMRDFEEEFTRLITGSSQAQSVGDWLAGLNLSQYENILVPNGFDDMDFIAGNVLEESDLIEMSIYNEQHRNNLLGVLKQLPAMQSIDELESSPPSTVEEWLHTLHLDVYLPVFLDHDYSCMDKVKRIWELELTTVLDITTLGHRKRIIASLGLSRPQYRLENMERFDLSTLSWTLGSEDSGVTFDMNHLAVGEIQDAKSQSSSDLRDTTSDLSSDVGTTSSTTSTSSDKSCDKSVGRTDSRNESLSASNSSERGSTSRTSRRTSSEQSDDEDDQPVVVVRRRPKSQQVASRLSFSGIELRPPQHSMPEANQIVHHWKHRPEELIKGCCHYFAQYLGSTFIRELTEESTHDSILKLKRRHWERLKNTLDNLLKLPLITLAISYRGVKFIDARSKKVICEHEIGNIFCVRQDDEHRNFFAYITEDLTSGKHYCHVFSVKTTDLAAEITLTLGEAFEVAYQMALREKSVQAGQEYEDLLLKTEAQIDYALAHH